jgi:hypothetical protein
MRIARGVALAFLVACATDEREPDSDPSGFEEVAESFACPDRNALRNVYFGDTHVHTGFSGDAYAFGVRSTPDDAYRFALGDPLALPSLEPGDARSRQVQLSRPLDFTAVTDHGEFLGEQSLCLDRTSLAYESAACRRHRSEVGRGSVFRRIIFDPDPQRIAEICGPDDARCLTRSADVWGEIRASAARHHAPCEFTTFIAYEYTGHTDGANLHRNVIFRGDAVPQRPISYIEAPRPIELWRKLRDECLEAGNGCDAIAIPHNANISNGRMFALEYHAPTGIFDEIEQARLRAQVEPLVEVMQHKGDSECRNGLAGVAGGADELCDFEKFRPLTRPGPDCEVDPLTGADVLQGKVCYSRFSYARYGLIEGLRELTRLGVNSLKFGLLASTDTHGGLAGAVAEDAYPGHLGIADATAVARTSSDRRIAGNTFNNPGGLAAVWATENTRDALFDAMRRREVYGTSGPRLTLRFFGGWAYAAEACQAPDLVQLGYAGGVPMGADLPPRPGDAAPRFLVSALRDPESGPLQRAQIIKGWIGDDGRAHQAVFEVAGQVDAAADVDPATCRPRGPGRASLCGVWTDPDFDPSRPAVYYARVLENPSCRYSARQCLMLPAAQRPPACDDPAIPRVVQERAWASPIWFEPGRSGATR